MESKDVSVERMTVVVRMRPILPIDMENWQIDSTSTSTTPVVWACSPNQVATGINQGTNVPPKVFGADIVLDQESCQDEAFESVFVPLIKSWAIDGLHCTCLAYGQTCSGKSFTMGTALPIEQNEKTGAIPRAISYIFDDSNKLFDAKRKRNLVVSFMEIYEERCRDLLSDSNAELTIRENSNGDTTVCGLNKVTITSVDQGIKALLRGLKNRVEGWTAANDRSSRSHALFTIETIDNGAKLHLVDLAGSERNKLSQAQGQRLLEARCINRSLLALGNVIDALARKPSVSNRCHVPYRDSKLTRVLRDSLGGRARTTMLMCVSSAEKHFDESYRTLLLSRRACSVRLSPQPNNDRIVSIGELNCDMNRCGGVVSNIILNDDARTRLTAWHRVRTGLRQLGLDSRDIDSIRLLVEARHSMDKQLNHRVMSKDDDGSDVQKNNVVSVMCGEGIVGDPVLKSNLNECRAKLVACESENDKLQRQVRDLRIDIAWKQQFIHDLERKHEKLCNQFAQNGCTEDESLSVSLEASTCRIDDPGEISSIAIDEVRLIAPALKPVSIDKRRDMALRKALSQCRRLECEYVALSQQKLDLSIANIRASEEWGKKQEEVEIELHLRSLKSKHGPSCVKIELPSEAQAETISRAFETHHNTLGRQLSETRQQEILIEDDLELVKAALDFQHHKIIELRHASNDTEKASISSIILTRAREEC